MTRVLLVGHAADRSGAPTSLLRMLRWLRAETDFELRVLLARGGELLPELRALAPVHVVSPSLQPRRSPWGKAANRLRIARGAGERGVRTLRRRYRADDFDLVFFNSTATVELMEALAHLECPVVGRVAELRGLWEGFGLSRVSALCRRASALVAVSGACRDALVALDPSLDARIQVIHGFAPLPPEADGTRPAEGRSARGRALRRELDVPDDAILVGGAGVVGWQKGSDLFVQVARIARSRRAGAALRFAWLGADPSGRELPRLRWDLERLGLAGAVHFAGPAADPARFYEACDLFALTSREDAFPLVVVEAACRGVPSVCFEGAGGAVELVADGAGAAVPYQDLEAMADALVRLAGDPLARSALGKAAAARARARCTPEAVVPRVRRLLLQALAGTDHVAPSPNRAAERAASHTARAVPRTPTPPAVAPVPAGQARPHWSVMIPTYACSELLEVTLRSVLEQDPGPDRMQIALVDDGSPCDRARRIAQRVGGSRIEFFGSPERRGIGGAWNACLHWSRGRWVHLLHQDDLVRPGFYARLEAPTREHPELGAALCRHLWMDGAGHWRGLAPLEMESPGVLEGWAERIASEQRIQCPAIVVRRDVYERLGGFRPDLHYALDWEMWIRIAAAFPVWYEPEPLAAYRMHEANESARQFRSAANAGDMYRAAEIGCESLPPALRSRVARRARRFCTRAVLRQASRLMLEGNGRAALAQVRAAAREDRSLWFWLHALQVVEPWLKHRLAGAFRAREAA